MKKQILLAIFSLVLGAGTASAQLNELWNQTYGGGNYDRGYAVVRIPDGGYAIAGSTRSFGAGNDDFYLVRTNSVGTVLWTRTFGGAGIDVCYALVRTNDGGLAMAGVTATGGANQDNFMLVKTDANGDNPWTRTFGGTRWESCYSLIETSDQGLALGGYTTTANPVINLGTASTFGVLAGASIPNTGSTVINGNLGIHPASSVTGFAGVGAGGPGVVNGVIHIANATAEQAKADLVTAYTAAAALNNNPTNVDAADLGGQTLTAGLYRSASTLAISNAHLTLNAQGNIDAMWVFQMGSTLTTAAGSQVILTNGAQARNVFWQVGSSATLGTNSVFKGTILALTSITATTGATIEGRLLARNGTVTLDANTITVPSGGSEDFMLVKTDGNGDNSSTFTYGTSGGERCMSLIQATDGQIVLGGFTDAQAFDFMLIKTNANGSVNWTRTFGGAGYEDCRSIIQTADGGFAMGGVTNSVGAGSYDFWMVKTDANGENPWTRTFGGASQDWFHTIIQTAGGGYALVGKTVSFGAGSWDAYLVMTKVNGDLVWDRTFGAAAYDQWSDVIETPDGGFALAGNTESIGAGNSDFWLMKTGAGVTTVQPNSYTMLGSLVQGNFDLAAWSALMGTVGTDWRLSQWSHAHQGYVRLGELDQSGNNWGDPDAMTAGKGFWIIHDGQTAVNLPNSGVVISTGAAVEASLNMDSDGGGNAVRGLTMLANPFQVPWNWNSVSLVRAGGAEVAMADVVTASAISPYAYQYSPGGGFNNYAPKSYTASFSFGPGEGFWALTFAANYQGDALNLRFNTLGLPNPTGLANQSPGRDDPDGWELSMEIACSDGIHGTNENKLGCKSNSVDGFDVWDASEFGSPDNASTQHYFPHPEQEFGRAGIYTYDFRSLEFDGPKVWNFTIRVLNLEDETFTMTYPSVEDVPDEYTLVLRDVDNDQIIGDMREVSQMTFRSTGNDIQRHFSVTCTQGIASAPGQELLPSQFGIISAYPNPFNNVTKITFGLFEASQVSISVIDIVGRQIAVLSHGPQTAGVHSVSWNAKGVESGIYILRLEGGNRTSTHKLVLVR